MSVTPPPAAQPTLDGPEIHRRRPYFEKSRGTDTAPPRLSADIENERRRELARQAAQIGAGTKPPPAPAPEPDPTGAADRYEAAQRLADEIRSPSRHSPCTAAREPGPSGSGWG